jgi:hypothetical protein
VKTQKDTLLCHVNDGKSQNDLAYFMIFAAKEIPKYQQEDWAPESRETIGGEEPVRFHHFLSYIYFLSQTYSAI